jgi:antitoxin PrlF
MRAKLRSQGKLTIPLSIRAALGLEVGDDVEFALTDDGSVILRPLKTVPDSQAWFWTSEWQRGERDASEDIAAGKVRTFASSESFLASLA